MRCEIATLPDHDFISRWASLSVSAPVFLDPGYLKALQDTLSPEERLYFCLFSSNQAPKGIAVLHLTRFEAQNVASNLDEGFLVSVLRRSFARKSNEMHILLCGNAFATGEHGYWFHPEIRPREAMDALCYAISEVIRNEKTAGNPISAVIVKDFYPRQTLFSRALRNCGFREFEVDQNMIMPIPSSWMGFDDYLSALNTKFRTKALSAIRKSGVLRSEELHPEQIKQWRNEMHRLYEQVLRNAEFRISTLTPSTLEAMKSALGDRMHVTGYFVEERMVAFRVSLECGDRLDAHLVGFDYSQNRTLAIYPRMLYDFISEAIRLRKSWVLFGRTAGEIKSSVGAFPVDLHCGIRHPGKLPNLFLNLLFAYVKPSAFEQRRPWKAVVENQLRKDLQAGPFGGQFPARNSQSPLLT